MAVLGEYQWFVVIGAFAAFAFGFGTGANDVANAFGTSVGSKTLTLRQAVTIAAIFEFVGALVLGRVSTNVIAGGVADITEFYREPEIYAYGMICALLVGAIWQILACYLELNVSATHSIIAGIMGFALVYAGPEGVLWAEKDDAAFPPYKGVLPIILSWFFSPILSASIAALIFFLCRVCVLRRENSYNMSFWLLPLAVMITTWINMYFVFTKGLKKTLSEDDSWTDAKAAWISAVIAAGLALLTCAAIPFLKKRIDTKFANMESDEMAAKQAAEIDAVVEAGKVAAKDDDTESQASKHPSSWFAQAKTAITHGVSVDVHGCIDEDEKLSAMHGRAEVFDAKTEQSFSYLQVFSACCVIFAHGAGEVGYMAGPLATIWDVYNTGNLTSKVTPPFWVVFIGAFGLVVGLYTYGYNVTRALGVKLIHLSPTRGFAAELATALVITLAAQYGLPNSSSQVITGAVVGVGLLEGSGGVNWMYFIRQFASWVATLVVVGGCVAALFAQGVYSPSIPASKSVMFYEDRIQNVTATFYSNVNTTLLAYQAPAMANQVPTLSPDLWTSLNKTVAESAAKNKALVDSKKAGSTDAGALISALFSAMKFVEPYTINTLGQVDVVAGAPLCNTNGTDSLLAASGVDLATDACPAAKLLPKGYDAFIIA